MALPKKKIPKDRPEIIRAREHMKPVDGTVVVAKLADGTVVEVRGHREPIVVDGVLTKKLSYYHPYDGPIDDKTKTALRSGVAEQYVFRWVNQHQRQVAIAQGSGRWMTVKRKDNDVYAPFAYGDMTDGLYHFDDLILHKRDRAYAEQLQSDKEAFHNVDRMMAQSNEDLQATLEPMGAKTITQTFEPVESESVTYTGRDEDE